MGEQLLKLSPARNLQCYFLTPSAIAAMSQASDGGFTLSGKWRQQFDWAVVEWNRDNTFEHPALRYLPDGDLSGLILTYLETRSGCIPVESNLVPVVDWNDLRIWATEAGGQTESVYHVDLAPLAVPVVGSYIPASATMTLVASPGSGKRAGLALLEEHFYYTTTATDGLSDIAAGIAVNINELSAMFSASSSGASVTVTWKLAAVQSPYPDLRGSNGNRITIYGFAEGGVNVWQKPASMFSGGQFPMTYQITVDFGALKSQGIPTDNVRKLRWTWSADLQAGTYNQTEFQVIVSEWTVTGANRACSVAGPRSRRIEDTDESVNYYGEWNLVTGNFSGSKIHSTGDSGDSCIISYSESAEHELYFGTRRFGSASSVSVAIDGQAAIQTNLMLAEEDVLVRYPLGQISPGSHTVTITNAGPAGSSLYFDFLEIAYPTTNLPDYTPQTQLALATDWDTYHSQSLPAERTAWMINKLGFQGRVNHYAGALWFYELVRTGAEYASVTVSLIAQTPVSNPLVVLNLIPIQLAGGPTPTPTAIQHLVLPDDTTADITQALSALINAGSNLVWASANGSNLTLTARAMGTQGNGIGVRLDPSSQGYSFSPAVADLSGGVDGAAYDLDTGDQLNSTLIAAADYWRTDLAAMPRINRAARDWHSAYFTALKGYGIDSVTSFSTELMNGDPSAATGIAQQYPDGTPVVLNTPSIQTNFSPTSLGFWGEVYLEMARLQSSAGLIPYLQFGEVQWWYFQKQVWNAVTGANVNIGMPFYDTYTQQQFQLKYDVAMQTILSNSADPGQYPNEVSFLPTLIGDFTAAIRAKVQAQFANCKFEVLYPTDTNNTALNEAVNFPASDWTAENLTCLKTESFTFTGNYDLDQSVYSMGVSAAKGFSSSQRSHLIGIGDAWTAWMKEANIAQSQELESVVLFALDQYCLIGYLAPPFGSSSKSQRQG